MITITENDVHKFGLVGRNIDYSFSKQFFTKKFERENLPYSYENFDIPSLEYFINLLSENPNLKGLNVTIPYKEKIMAHLDTIDAEAKKIGAVNTIKISEDNQLTGFNTDHYGFQKSLEAILPLRQKTALILGTGGASKAVAYALQNLGFNFKMVSRNASAESIAYSDLDEFVLAHHLLIVNCTPLGTFPNIGSCPPIPYQYLTTHHLLFDLTYNPAETEFLIRGKSQGAKTVNGLKMLTLQAERAWEIWFS